jgi:hypothetical protein
VWILGFCDTTHDANDADAISNTPRWTNSRDRDREPALLQRIDSELRLIVLLLLRPVGNESTEFCVRCAGDFILRDESDVAKHTSMNGFLVEVA